MKRLFLALIVVLGIGAAVPKTRAMMEQKVEPLIDGVKTKMVPRRLQAMADQLEARLGRGEGYPKSWEGWLRRDYTAPEKDPWGNLYFLDTSSRDFTVGSMGPDGVQGTPDDIKLKRRPRKN